MRPTTAFVAGPFFFVIDLVRVAVAAAASRAGYDVLLQHVEIAKINGLDFQLQVFIPT